MNDMEQLAEETYSSEAFLSVNKNLIKTFGPEIALYISNLIDKKRYLRSQNRLRHGGFFYAKMEDQVEELGMSEYQLRKCENKLKKMGVLTVDRKGIPAKKYYSINMEKLLVEVSKNKTLKNLRSGPEKTKGLYPKKLKVYNKVTKNKGNKNKVNKNEKKKKKKKKKVAVDKKVTPSMFEKFWDIYPRKKDKGTAKRAWEKLCNKNKTDRPTFDQIEKSIEAQKKTPRWQNKKYIAYPSTWINNYGWLNDPSQMNEGGTVKETPDISPEDIIQKRCKSKVRTNLLLDKVYVPASKLLPDSENGDLQKLANNLVDLSKYISKNREKVRENVEKVLPNQFRIMTDYIEWIEENDWITSRSPDLFNPDSKLFKKYLKESAKNWNNRNPVTGKHVS